MEKTIKSIKLLIHKIKIAVPILKLLPAYFRNTFHNQFISFNKTNKCIIFTLDNEYLFRDDDGCGREAYYTLKAFSDGNYNVYFYRPNDFRNYWRLNSLGRLIFGIKNLKFISKIPAVTKDFIYAFDTVRPDFLKYTWKKLIYINIKKSTNAQAGNVIPMQFPMMPYIYACGEDKKLEQYRKIIRRCKIFFAGNLNPIYYDSPIFKQKYPHIMTRLEGLKTIINSKLNVWLIKKIEDFKKFSDSLEYLNYFVVVDTGSNAFPIKPENWLNIVAQNDFFMCFSGTDYPMCHNAIEAMAVGSIPIVAYADWFDPHLEHGKNAIIYSNKEDMIQKIKLVLQMPQNEIQELRQGVLEYYDNYLAVGSLARKYEAQAQPISTLMLFTNFVSDLQGEKEAQNLIKKFERFNIQKRILNVKS